MQQFILPIKREFWEHSAAFIRTPIIVFVLLSLAVFAAVVLGSKAVPTMDIEYQRSISGNTRAASEANEKVRAFEYSDLVVGQSNDAANEKNVEGIPSIAGGISKATTIVANVPYIIFGSLLFIILFSYALSCLFADRKDGSILFWKSLPVSETQNVSTKLFVAVFVLPAIAWLAALLLSVVILCVALLAASFSGQEGAVSLVMQSQSIVGTAWRYIGTFLAISFWFLPVLGWLIFASSTAKKSPFLFAALPPIVLMMVEHTLLNSHYFIKVFMHFTLGMDPVQCTLMLLQPDWDNLAMVFSSTTFWLGIVFAAGFSYGAIWMRENRYER